MLFGSAEWKALLMLSLRERFPYQSPRTLTFSPKSSPTLSSGKWQLSKQITSTQKPISLKRLHQSLVCSSQASPRTRRKPSSERNSFSTTRRSPTTSTSRPIRNVELLESWHQVVNQCRVQPEYRFLWASRFKSTKDQTVTRQSTEAASLSKSMKAIQSFLRSKTPSCKP